MNILCPRDGRYLPNNMKVLGTRHLTSRNQTRHSEYFNNIFQISVGKWKINLFMEIRIGGPLCLIII